MERREKMHWPFGGLSDDRAFNSQEPGTTREAQNVRNIDPVDGRSKGSQRAGQSKYNTNVAPLGAAPVVDVRVVTRDAVKTEYINRGVAGNDAPDDNRDLGDTTPVTGYVDAPEWTAESEDFQDAIGVAVDAQENVYTLSASGILTKFNSAGAKLRTVTVPSVRGSVLVPKVEVDLNGGVVVAVGASTNLKGAVYRYADNALNSVELEQDWEIVTEGRVSMFGLDTFSVFVVQEKGVGEQQYTLSRYDNTQDGVTPTRSLEQECPGPVNQLVIDGNGAVKMCVEGLVDKGVVPSAPEFTKRIDETLLWTPADLDDADERIFSWLDATNIDGFGNATLEDGDTVDVWEDVRPINLPGLYDKTVRRLMSNSRVGASPARPAPTYKADMGSGMPGVSFDGNAETAGVSSPLLGQVLQSEKWNGSFTSKSLPTDELPAIQSVWPGYGNPDPVRQAFFVVVRVKRQQYASVLFSQQGANNFPGITGGMAPSIILNGIGYGQSAASTKDDRWDDAPGFACYHNKPFAFTGGALHSPIEYGNADSVSGTPGAQHKSQVAPYEFGESGLLLVSIVTDEWQTTGTGSTAYSQVRMNGTLLGDFAAAEVVNSGVGGFEHLGTSVFGGRRRLQDEAASTDYYLNGDVPITSRGAGTPTGMLSFSGEILEIVSVLAGTNATAHDENVRNFNNKAEHTVATDEWSLTQWLARQDPGMATEVELIEGYLAHKWGMAHQLPHDGGDNTGGNTGAPTPPKRSSASSHPFGGTGNYPGKPIVGTDPDPKRNAQSEWRADSGVLKYAAGTLDLSWAMSGSGTGYSLGVDGDQSALAVGHEDLVPTGTDLFLGPDNKTQVDVVGRKVVDGGTLYDIPGRSRGAFSFVGHNTGGAGSSQPSDGVTVTVGDGATTEIFEFKDPGPASGDNEVQVEATVFGTTQRLTEKIDGHPSFALKIAATQIGPWSCEIVGLVDSDTQLVLSTSVTAEVRVYGGVQGSTGSIIADTWTLTDANGGGLRRSNMIAADDNDDWWLPDWKNGEPERVQKVNGETGDTALEPFYDMPEGAHAVALPLSNPQYLPIDPFAPGTVPTGSLFMYVAGATDGAGSDTLHKVRLITESLDFGTEGENSRETYTVGVVGGKLVKFDRGAGAVEPLVPDVALDPALLNADSPYIMSTVMFNTIYVLDGRGYIYWEATNALGGKFESRSGGEIPKGARLIENWRGRLALARTDEDPHNVFFSRVGDPWNWDQFPAVPDGLEATSFTNSRVGRNADIVNTLVSYNDDLLMVGGDHTIQVLRGDPLADGQLDLITDVTGMAFGESWCKDPHGVLYFFGSRGGVYRWVPGGAVPERITRDRIERRMQDLDLSVVRVRLSWNWKDEGLHVVVIPLAPAAGSVTHPSWFMDKMGAWWEDSWTESALQPHSLRMVDGDDPDDRVLLLGGEDGFVRFWDQAAKDDDGTRIDAHVLIGPLMPGTADVAFGFRRPEVVLATGKDGCLFEFIGASTAETATEPSQRADLKPGRNPRLPIGIKDSAVYARLRNAALSESFGFESLTVSIRAAGRHRP